MMIIMKIYHASYDDEKQKKIVKVNTQSSVCQIKRLSLILTHWKLPETLDDDEGEQHDDDNDEYIIITIIIIITW